MKHTLFAASFVLLSFAATAQTYKGNDRPKSPEQQLNDEYATGLFKSTDGQIFDIANANNSFGYLNILDWLEGRVAGLQIYKTRTGLSVPVIRGTIATVYVDEMPVGLSFMQSINNFDIAMIKVIKSPFMGGPYGGGGAIAIYTLRGEDEDEEGDSK